MAPAVRRLRLQQKWLLARYQWKLLLMRESQEKAPAEVAGAVSVEAAADASCRKVKNQRQ